MKTQPYFVIGEHIKGEVVLDLVGDYPIRKVEVRFVGEEQINVYGKSFTKELVKFICVLDKTEIDENIKVTMPKVLNKGKHNYPFAFAFPPNSKFPATGSHQSLSINYNASYQLKAYVQSYNPNINNLKKTEEVEILEKLRSNTNVIKSSQEEVKGLICGSGSADMVCKIDYSGFVLPAGLKIDINYNNKTCNKTVRQIEVKLIQKVRVLLIDNLLEYMEQDIVGEWILPGIRLREDKIIKRRLLVDGPGVQLDLHRRRHAFPTRRSSDLTCNAHMKTHQANN